MAKKKKTALKPVARGFATTSVPKKVVEAADDVIEPMEITEEVSTPETAVTSADNGVALSGDNGAPSNEDQAMQSLVEKLQEKTEKEVTRVVKVCISVVHLFIRCLMAFFHRR
jgi:ATP-dependent RNA helicase DHX29